MDKIIFSIALWLALSVPFVASAQQAAPQINRLPLSSSQKLSAVLLTADAADRTFTISGLDGRYTDLGLVVTYTKDSGATTNAITCTCTGAMDSACSRYGSKTSTDVVNGTGTVVAYVDSFAVTATASFELNYKIRGYYCFKCVLAGSGGTLTGHTVTTDGMLLVGGGL